MIVDDQPKQALPIITALSKQGIATTWYRGNNPDEMPEQPLQKVRLIFMDLQLIEGDNDAHTIASRVLHILEHIIPSDNGPYMLVIWSLKDALYAEELKERLKLQNDYLCPVCTVTLNKKDCIRQKQEVGAHELIEEVLAQLTDAGFEDDELTSVADAIKNKWIVDKDAEYEVLPEAVATIENAIAEELKKAGVFHLFIIWENLIKSSAAHTVANISATLPHDETWEQNMRDVFRRMGIARVGQNEISDEELLKESVLTFIQSFTDSLETSIQEVKLPDYASKQGEQLIKVKFKESVIRLVAEDNVFKIFQDDIDENSQINSIKIAENKDKHKLKAIKIEWEEAVNFVLDIYKSIPPHLNTKLHLEQNPTNVLVPGNIYEVNVKEDDRERFADTYFINIDKEELKLIRFIELEVSPICDYAQKKWKKCRLVSGVIYPESLAKKLRVQNDHLYKAQPVFFLDDGYVKMVFDYHLLKSRDPHEIRSRTTLKYRLRRELLLDIIANVSAHVNRPGISFVS